MIFHFIYYRNSNDKRGKSNEVQKRTFGSLFIIALLLILAACSGGKDEGGKGKKVLKRLKNQTQKITIFQSKVEISDQLEALAKE